MLSCFGGNTFGRSGGSGCDSNQSRRSRCQDAVENAVNQCGSERAVERALNERDNDDGCGCEDVRSGRSERAERFSDNINSRDISGTNPPHWQDFPGVASANSREDCGCD